MTRKVIKVGSSAAITIPSALLKKLGLSIGDSVLLESVKKGVLVRPVDTMAGVDSELVSWARDFNNKRYAKALRELAEK